MNTNFPIYLSYTDLDGAPPYFQTLDSQGGFDLIRASAPSMGRQATVLHTRGRADDAPLEIVCVTNAPISREVAEAVSQAAINYAMETGLIPMRVGGQGGQHGGFSPS